MSLYDWQKNVLVRSEIASHEITQYFETVELGMSKKEIEETLKDKAIVNFSLKKKNINDGSNNETYLVKVFSKKNAVEYTMKFHDDKEKFNLY